MKEYKVQGEGHITFTTTVWADSEQDAEQYVRDNSPFVEILENATTEDIDVYSVEELR